jgi:hypothetical protein
VAILKLNFEERKNEQGETGVYVGWDIEQCNNSTMNELAELVKELVYKEMNTAVNQNQEEKSNVVH